MDNEVIIYSGYADNKEAYNHIKELWASKEPEAKVRRVRTDTKGLIAYAVYKEQ